MSYEAIHTPGFYTPSRQEGSGPSQESCLCSKRTRRRPRRLAGAAHPIRSWERCSIVVAAPRMWMIVEPSGNTWEVCPEHSGNPWRLSSGGSWRRSAAIRNRCDVSSPLPLKGGGTSEGLCDVVVVDHNRHHTLMRRPGPLGGLGVEGFERCTCHAALTPATDIKGVPSPRPRSPVGDGNPIENTSGLNL